MATHPNIIPFEQSVEFASIGDAIKEYIRARNELDVERKSYNEYEAQSKHYLKKIETFVLQKADELGVESFRTAFGTAYKNKQIQYRISNWEEYIEWVKSTNNFQCLEKRAAKNAVKEVSEETGEIPPGLSVHEEIGFDFRKPSK